VARTSATQLNLRGSLPQATFVAVLAAAHAGALWALVAFFSGGGTPLLALSDLLPHALVSGLAAPFVIGGVVRLLAWLGEDDGQRPLRLEPRALVP
jgi:fatty acid desaturase